MKTKQVWFNIFYKFASLLDFGGLKKYILELSSYICLMKLNLHAGKTNNLLMLGLMAPSRDISDSRE